MNKKFTFIELLIVIAIISILVSLLLPVISKARKTARIAICSSNTKQIFTATYSYSTDNKSLKLTFGIVLKEEVNINNFIFEISKNKGVTESLIVATKIILTINYNSSHIQIKYFSHYLFYLMFFYNL